MQRVACSPGSTGKNPRNLPPLGLQRTGVVLLAALFALAAAPVTANPDLPPFQSAEGRPLPLDEDEILEFLRTAPVIESKVLETGINGTLKLTLMQGGVRAHAAFRTVDLEFPPRYSDSRPNRFTFHDSYRFEVAAYRLSRLFGLDRVPPTVLRRIGGREGSLQLWIENANTEASLRKEGRPRELKAPRHLQKQTMRVFDELIYNFDRNLNNFLYDSSGRLWLIDHTRSFKKLPTLNSPARLVTCDRTFLERLRTIPNEELNAVLHGLLPKMERDALIKRRRIILKRFDRLIADRGEDYVLYDLQEETAQAATQSVARDLGTRAEPNEPSPSSQGVPFFWRTAQPRP